METRKKLSVWAVSRSTRSSVDPEVLSIWDTHTGAKKELNMFADKFKERMFFEWNSKDSFSFCNGDETISMQVTEFPLHSEVPDEACNN